MGKKPAFPENGETHSANVDTSEAVSPSPSSPLGPGKQVKWRLCTHNVWGVSVKDPMTRPLNCTKQIVDMAHSENWTSEPFVIGLQEVYCFRTDPLSFQLSQLLLWAERQVWHTAPLLLYIVSFFSHLVLVLINALILYPINHWRHAFFGSRVFDVKRIILPTLLELSHDDHGSPIVRGYDVDTKDSTTFHTDLRISGDSGTLMVCGGGLGASKNTHGFSRFSHSMGSEMCCNKGVQWVYFHEQNTAIINTHMQAADDPFRWLAGSADSYKKQVQEVRELIRELEDNHAPEYIFLMGDLNTFQFDADKVQETFGLFKLTYDSATHVDGCVDHILCSKKFPADKLKCRHITTPSDHMMVVLEILA